MQQIVWKKTSEVIPYEKNPRINDKAVEYVANSLKEFGWKQPIVVDKDFVIIAGHTRLKAAKKLKMETVPVIVADDLNEQQAKAYRLADNKVAEVAEWDIGLLDEELGDIFDFDMADFGFDFEEEEEPQEVVEDEVPEVDEDAEPIAKLGDIWQLGRHHPTQKPIKLAEWFLSKYSKDGETILDLFGGSGSTLVACEQLERTCYTMELDPKYCDVIIARWEHFTGEKAVLLNE